MESLQVFPRKSGGKIAALPMLPSLTHKALDALSFSYLANPQSMTTCTHASQDLASPSRHALMLWGIARSSSAVHMDHLRANDKIGAEKQPSEIQSRQRAANREIRGQEPEIGNI
jgi:hypothetical protein